MKKKERELIFNKYDGKCAYCGCELQKGWHVDEIEPVRRGWEYVKDANGNRVIEGGEYKTKPNVMHPERFHIDNQNPSCASCNINKHSESLEDFRKAIKKYVASLNNYSTQYKIAKRYGLINENEIEVEFYFEKIKNLPK